MQTGLVNILIDIALMTLLTITAIGIMRSRHLFATAMLSGIYSLITAALFVTLDAVDVAFTEAAVGAGISTVLMLGAMTLTRRSEKHAVKLHIGPILVCLAVGAALIYGTVDMPPFGSIEAAGFNHIVPEYIAGSRDDIQVPNIVTSILASYRGFDTLGEVAVIFTAGIGVMFLIGRKRREDDATETGPKAPGDEA
ncbi:DUF4040 domain-containing protein [Nisaea acidiphila]|uniref:DUF4040 domain-containing protein n=1 Tax=Nisaea acidiphila TaxID=1862145 RepID=A0A9J7AU70_9PROT|nr:DUF4040 domain-containing protein [Nisaea acidiphila]UUX50033.1 DUF4040 domain-containing protein [Nisaea acidiphila]